MKSYISKKTLQHITLALRFRSAYLHTGSSPGFHCKSKHVQDAQRGSGENIENSFGPLCQRNACSLERQQAPVDRLPAVSLRGAARVCQISTCKPIQSGETVDTVILSLNCDIQLAFLFYSQAFLLYNPIIGLYIIYNLIIGKIDILLL